MANEESKVQVQQDKETPKSAAVSPFWEPIDNLRREVDKVFENFGETFGWRRRPAAGLELSWPPKMTWGLSPAVDIAEKDKEYQVTAELPGLEEADVDVSVSNGLLTIKGEKKEEKEEKEKDYYLCERRYGSFQRSFSVPEGVDTDKIAATFKKGILTVTLPKTAEARNNKKKIPVKAG